MLGVFGGGDVEMAGAGVGVDLDLRLLRRLAMNCVKLGWIVDNLG